MRKNGKKLLSLALALLMVLALLPTAVLAAEPTSGTYSKNLTWTLLQNGVLTISGTGEMKDFSPWYSELETITSVIIGDGVTIIGAGAFSYCTGLTSFQVSAGNQKYTAVDGVLFSKDLKTIVAYPCGKKDAYTIPNSVTSIEYGAFMDCTGLTSVTIPDSVTSIGNSAFEKCTNLASVTIPNSVTSIGRGAFFGCSGLISVTIPSSVTEIGGSAFEDCKGLTAIQVESNNRAYTAVDGVLFNKSKTGLVKYPEGRKGAYTIPNDVTSIGENAFAHCTGLTGVTIPNGVTRIEFHAFYRCEGLTSVAIPNSVTEIGRGAFVDCKSLTSVTIPNSVSRFELAGFSGCTSLTSVTIPDSITSIGEYAFYCCTGLTSVTIPNSVISIGDHAFYNCTGLSDVYYGGNEAQWDAVAIGDDNDPLLKATIHYNCTGENDPGTAEVEFDPEIYRANILLDTSNAETATMLSVLSGNTPCSVYVPLLQENNFETWATAWTTLTTTFDAIDNPSTLHDFAAVGKDVYSAIVLNLLEASTDYGIVDACNGIIDDSKKFVSEINTLLKVEYDIDVSNSYDWRALSENEQNIIKDVCEKFYKEEYQADIASLNKVFSNFGKSLSVADCLETYVEQISSAYAVVEMSDSLKTVVKTMYQQCPSTNTYLKLALADCIEIIDSSTEELLAKLFTDGLSVVGVEVGQYLIDELWKDVKSVLNLSYPYLDIILAGYKTGKFISNTLFSTDSTLEQYCVMLATIDVESLMADVVQSLAQTYTASPTRVAASAYLSALDLLFASRDQDCSAANKFVDVLDDALVNQIGALFDQTGANQRTSIKNSISSIQTTYDNTHSSILKNWIFYLEEDYPDSGLYEEYYSLYIQDGDLTTTKKYVAACPVNVNVYDSEDNLVAYVIDNNPCGYPF